MQKITPFLWFNGQAEEAANLYTSLFKNSKIGNIARYEEAGPGPKGTVMSVTFQLNGQEFIALNGGPQFTFSPAVSFLVSCETQEEVDRLWENSPKAGEKTGAAGFKTNTAYPGKSFLQFSAQCCMTRIRRNRGKS